MAQPRRLTRPSVSSVGALLAELDDDGFNNLAAELAGPDAFDTDIKRCKTLGLKLGLNADAVQTIVSLVDFLYERINGDDGVVSDEELQQLLGEIIDQEDDQTGDGTRRLAQLVHRSSNLDEYVSIRLLKTGYLPQAKRFTVTVDFRAKMAENVESLEAIIPLLQLRIVSDSSDTSEKSVVFQLDRKGLEALDHAVRVARDKLDIASSDPRIAALIKF